MDQNGRGDNTTQLEAEVTQAQKDVFTDLTVDERARLSKTLFPDFQANKISVLGRERALRPLSLRYAKVIHANLKPLATKVAEGLLGKQEVADTFEQDVTEGLKHAALVMAVFYEWKDVEKAVKEEDISLVELQALAVTQTNLNGQADFLLSPLRTCLGVMRVHEIAQVRFNSLMRMPMPAEPPVSQASATHVDPESVALMT